MRTKRERLEDSCRQILRTAAQWADSNKNAKYKAYAYAHDRLDGMWTALLDVCEDDYLALVENYRQAALTKIDEALGI